MKLNKFMAVMVVSSALVLSGCSAMGTAIKKRNLEVKTQMSETIWLEPSNNKTVYLQIKNTSDKDMSGLQAKIASAVTSKGYQVVSNPDTAGYWIQANVLKADKMDLRESQGWLSRGYEGAVTGAALGAGITAYNSSSAGATLGVGLAAGLVGMAADAMVEDVNYTMITDVQIAERTKHRFRLITWPYYVREHPEQKCRQVLKRVISINTRLASSLTRIKLTSSSLKPSLFLKTSWQNRSLISCKRSIPRPGYSGPDWHHLSGVSEFIRQIIS